MQIAPRPENEVERLAFLHALEILDTEPEERFDSITRLACKTLGAKFSAVSLVDDDRQWFKSQCGLDVNSTSRDVSFCAHTILDDQTMMVEDALLDPRFHDNSLVSGPPHLRSYLGHRLTVSGVVLGALCVLYTEPRTFNSEDVAILRDFARLVEEMIAHQEFREAARLGMDEVVSAGDIILAKAIRMSPEPTVLFDSRRRTIADLNLAGAEQLGVVREEVIGHGLPFPPSLVDARQSELEDALERTGRVKDFEIDLETACGDTARFLCSAETVFRAGSRHLLVSGRNISTLTERESLYRSAQLATGGKIGRHFFEACAEVMTKELDLRFGLVLGLGGENSEALRVLGFRDRDGVITAAPPISDLIPYLETENNRVPYHVSRGVREQFPDCQFFRSLGAESCYSHPVISASGDLCGYLILIDKESFADDSDRAPLLLGILAAYTTGEIERQVMHRKLEQERERAEAANRAKGTFLSNMSHELRTPMNAIIGFSQLMARSENLSPEQRETLEIVNQSGEHLLTLINDVLEMSAIEAGQIELELSGTELDKFISRILQMLSAGAREKGLELSSKIDAGVTPFVKIDQGKTRQILVNLIGNAIKFTRQGHVRLHVSSIEGPNLLFEIEDTGSGIEEEAQSRLFQPFEQIDRKKGLEGTGLGLSICKGYVDAMGGQIGMSSPPESGSRFFFTVPLVPCGIVSEAPAVPQELLRTAPPKESSVTRILIVDDIDPGRMLLRRLLSPLGVELREAKNGQEAVEIEEEWRPHIIFMDLRMPIMDGERASTLIRQSRGDSSPVIIAITASVFRENLLSPGSPFDEYVSKPFRIKDVLQLVETHLN